MDDLMPGDLHIIEETVQGNRPARIWKHHLLLKQRINHIPMPRGARILAVAAQNDGGYLWEIHDVSTEDDLIDRSFEIVGTGHTFDSAPLFYIGTYQTYGQFVWHVFEISGA